jgi:UDP-glucose 4-epimerase
MAILVTGGAGYIGSHMVFGLLDRGVPVVVLDNLATGFRSAIPASVPFVEGDIGDADLVSRLIETHKVDEVIHFAASSVVPESMEKPAAYYANNTAKSLALIDLASRSGVRRFVFSSTAAVYGNPVQSPVAETALPQPVSPYGTSKWMTELVLRDVAAARGMRHVALRYFNVAGADPALRCGQSTRAATHLIKAAVQAALGIRDGLDIYGTDYLTPDGTCVRDYIHVTDLVDAHFSALEYLRGCSASTTLNCGYGRGYSVREVVDAVKRISRVDFPVRLAGRRPGDPATIVADTARLRRELNWTPAYDDLDTIVAHALAWERQLHDRRASMLP